jgi:hypothetical protein
MPLDEHPETSMTMSGFITKLQAYVDKHYPDDDMFRESFLSQFVKITRQDDHDYHLADIWRSFEDPFPFGLPDWFTARDILSGTWELERQIGLGGTRTALATLKGTIHADAVMQEIVNPIMARLDEEKNLGYLDVPLALTELLEGQGVNVTSQGTVAHAHAAHKTMETNAYRNVYPPYLAKDSVAVFFTKDSKFKRLSQLHNQFKSYHNVVLDHKDWSRYGQCQLPTTLTESAILLWDVGQYLNPVNLAAIFAKYPSVQRVYSAFVYAPESAQGLSSIYPEYYQLQYEGDQVVYKMEGTDQGSYEQPRDCDWLFEARNISVVTPHQDFYLHHEPLHSSLTHHLAVTSRQAVQVSRKVWTCDSRDLMHIPQPWLNQRSHCPEAGEQLIPRELYNNLYWYYAASNVNKRSAQDVSLKIRNLRASPKYSHIRPEVWRLLLESVIAVGIVNADVPLGNEFDSGIAACIWRYILTTVQSCNLPGPWAVAYRLASTILPALFGLPWKLISSALSVYEVANASNWTELGLTLGKTAFYLLAPAPVVATFTAVVGVAYAAAYATRFLERRELKLQTQVLMPRFQLTYRARDIKVHFDPADDANPFTITDCPINMSFFMFKRCEECGKVSSSRVCSDCQVCPTHHLQQLDRERGAQWECCMAVAQGQAIEAEFQRTQSKAAEVEARTRPDDTGRPRGEVRQRLVPACVPREEHGPRHTIARASAFSVGSDTSSEASIRRWATNVQPGKPNDDDSGSSAAPDSEVEVMHHDRQESHSSREIATRNFRGLGHTGTLDHPLCNCKEHDEDQDWPGRVWKRCVGNRYHWEATGNARCHQCLADPVVAQLHQNTLQLDQRCYIHECTTIKEHMVHSAKHSSYIINRGNTQVGATPNTCLVNAIAKATGLQTSLVWSTICAILPQSATVDLLPSPGLDERSIHAAGLLLGFGAQLRTSLSGVPKYAGLKTGEQYIFTLTESDGVPHWEFTGAAPVKLKGLAEDRPAPNPLVTRFLDELDGFLSEHDEPILGNWQDVTLEKESCKQLVREFKNDTFGTIKRLEGKRYEQNFTQTMDAIHEHSAPRVVSMRGITGCAGCGKSAPLKEFLKKNQAWQSCKGVWLMSAPRQLIRQDWADDLKLGRGGYALNTFEQALTRTARVLIIDELSLFPPGYVDLFCILKPSISHVILLGDTVQSRFNNPNADSCLNEATNEAERCFARLGGDYCFWTHRSPKVIADAYGIPTTSPVQGRVSRTTQVDSRYPIIAATNGETGNLNFQGNNARNVGGSQGATYHTAQIMVTSTMLQQQTAGDFYSAVGRVTHHLILVESYGPGYTSLLNTRADVKAVMGLTGPVDFKALFNRQLAAFNIVYMDPKKFADTVAKRATKLAKISRIRSMRQALSSASSVTRANGQATTEPCWTDRAPPTLEVLLNKETYVMEPSYKPIENREPRFVERTHLPRADPARILDQALDGLTYREQREVLTDAGMTSCFTERHNPSGMPTEQLFPNQRGTDPILFPVTIKKRLSPGSVDDNLEDLHSSDWKAQILFDHLAGYLGFQKFPEKLDVELFEQCIFETEFRKLTTKTQQTLLNNVKRGDPLWKFNFVDHFVKSQLKAKLETLGKPAKAGQSLATCHDAVILLFGPMVRYLRCKVMHRFPAELYCNCEKTADDFDLWAREHWVDQESTESDLENFDSTQRGDSLGIELKLMYQFGLDRAHIALFDQFMSDCRTLPELYLFWKTHIISSVIGLKQTGRDTGEPGTYDFNTYYNLALTILMYNLPRGVPLAVGGDDMSANKRLVLSPLWLRIRKHFLTVAKVEYTIRPSFCGYYVTSHGAYRNPRLLALKTMYHLDQGTQHLVDLSYAGEAYSAYRLGDKLIELCSWTELECLGWLIEYYHQTYSWAQSIFGAEADPVNLAAMLLGTGGQLGQMDVDSLELSKGQRRALGRVFRFQVSILKVLGCETFEQVQEQYLAH